jgi:dTDP-4-dehydrorhamnose 3,5-epimerase-like enzyme
MSKWRMIEIPIVNDDRGKLAVIENNSTPFELKRVYYLYDVPASSERGSHAHKKLRQLMIAISGSFKVKLTAASKTEVFILSDPSEALLIEPGVWRDLYAFSAGAVCMVAASDIYDESDYIRDFEEFKKYDNQIL